MSRLVATGLAALPVLRAMIPATIAMTVGGINPVIPTFRARASRPAAQESPCGPVGVRGIVETISDHVLFISPHLGYIWAVCGKLFSNEMTFIYAVR